jgi:hypothetical protein
MRAVARTIERPLKSQARERSENIPHSSPQCEMRAFYYLRRALRNLFASALELLPGTKKGGLRSRPSSVYVTSPHNYACQRVAGNWNKSLKSPIAGLFTGTYGLPNSCFGLGKLSRLRLLMVGRSQLYSMNFRIDTWSV